MPDDLVFGVVYKYICGICNYSDYNQTDRHLNVRPGEHTGILPLTLKKTKPANKRSMRDHLLKHNNHPSFGGFSVIGIKIYVDINTGVIGK